jgi:hypothetical protein
MARPLGSQLNEFLRADATVHQRLFHTRKRGVAEKTLVTADNLSGRIPTCTSSGSRECGPAGLLARREPASGAALPLMPHS